MIFILILLGVKVMQAKLYTDGSSNYKLGKVGTGSVIVDNSNNILSEISKEVDKPELLKYNNVAGEILACCYGIEKCIELGVKQVEIHVDYIGLIKWYDGTWRTKNNFTKLYVNMLREYGKFIDFNFIKVKAHSNDKWNEYADKLAKKSIK